VELPAFVSWMTNELSMQAIKGHTTCICLSCNIYCAPCRCSWICYSHV